MVTTAVLLLVVGLLAFSNGANDNFKGVATLYGSHTTGYRTALVWATVTTAAGSLAAVFLAQELLGRFTGKGLVPDALVGSGAFVVAVALGAGLTVLLATRLGFPISTTHALTGALVGSGLMAAGPQVNLAVLGAAFLTPLLVSPLLAVGLGSVLYRVLAWCRLRLGVTEEWCVCVGNEVQVIPGPAAMPVMLANAPAVTVGEEALCRQRYGGRVLGLGAQQIVDGCHFLSAGVVSFARGLNDTPKMAALLLVLPGMGGASGLAAVAAAIAAGGWLGARRVSRTLSHDITDMNTGQGLSANLTTGLLVIGASLLGMPVSTTHVSVGSLFGIGVATGQGRPRVMRDVMLSWVITLPCAAALGALAYALAA